MQTKGPSNRRSFVKNLAVGVAAVPGVLSVDAALAAPAPQNPTAHKGSQHVFNIQNFGAIPDGKTLATKSIQAAIDACSAAGGGRVVVPPGRYLTAPLFLKSNLELEIMAGATLLGTTNFDDYPTMQGRWEGLDRTIHASLLTGQDLENVSITGRGTLDGQGDGWWKAHRETAALRRKLGLSGREPENPPGSPLRWPRPRMINLYRCKNVQITGIRLINSPSWNLHPVLCENLWIDGITIINPENSPNTDGIDPDSCKLVRISNCYITTGDDCIVIKSGYKYQPGVTQIPSEDIVITNCVFGTGHAGVAIGSETSGGVRNVTVSNCVCNGTRRGLYIKSARGRGNIVENFRASNVVMKDLVEDGILIGMFYQASDRETIVPKSETTPTFRNFHFSNITVEHCKRGIVIEGLPENPIREVSVQHAVVNGVDAGFVCSTTQAARFEDLVVNPNKGASFSLSDVQDVELESLRSTKPVSGEVVIRLDKAENISIAACSAPKGSRALIEVHGTGSRDVVLALNRVPKGMQEIALTDGAEESAVEKRA